MMFKKRPIRPNCPVCKAYFVYVEPPVVEKAEKKAKKAPAKKKKKAASDEPSEPKDPTHQMLYQIMFDRAKINQPLLNKIKAADAVEFHKQEMKLGCQGLLLQDVPITFEYGNHYKHEELSQ